MYLIDTNIFLHVLLKKDHFESCFNLLSSNENFYVTDFSVYSICILLSKLRKYELMKEFIDDLTNSENVDILEIDLMN
jgi:predicted nucleic acid-binding protein